MRSLSKHLVRVACIVSVLSGFANVLTAEDAPNPEVLQMVVELVTSADRDMRGLGLEQVRTGVPGEAATKQLAALVSKLPADGQATLLDALGERGDRAARPAVLAGLESPDAAVRGAAYRALGSLGDASDVARLVQKAAGAEKEKELARQSLVRLRGDRVHEVMIAQLATAAPGARVELLRALAARNAKESVASVLKLTADPDRAVRVAALRALRDLASEKDLGAMLQVLKSIRNEGERGAAEAAILAVCRGKPDCAGVLAAAIQDSDAPTRSVLVRALGRAGGAKSLDGIAVRLEDNDSSVRDEAMRTLSNWPDPAVVPHLRKVAQQTTSPNWQVLALRGLVRLARPQADRPADMPLLSEAMTLAKRPEDKRLVIGALGELATPASLALVAKVLDDPVLCEEASIAAVSIAERLPANERASAKAAMEKVVQQAKQPATRDRAEKLLKSLGK